MSSGRERQSCRGRPGGPPGRRRAARTTQRHHFHGSDGPCVGYGSQQCQRRNRLDAAHPEALAGLGVEWSGCPYTVGPRPDTVPAMSGGGGPPPSPRTPRTPGRCMLLAVRGHRRRRLGRARPRPGPWWSGSGRWWLRRGARRESGRRAGWSGPAESLRPCGPRAHGAGPAPRRRRPSGRPSTAPAAPARLPSRGRTQPCGPRAAARPGY